MPGFSHRERAKISLRIYNKTTKQAQGLQSDIENDDGVIDTVVTATEIQQPGHGWGRGIVSDFKNTIAKHWFKEILNFNTKTIGVSIFLFIAVIAPTITFGAVYAKMTNNYIGASELLLGTAWCGIFYSLVSGQPMMVNGATGPVLTFQAVLYKMAENLHVPFLSFNAWVGLWVALYMVLAAFVDLNRLIKYATRFTDEIFAFLIVSIYILDAVGNPTSQVGLMHYFRPSHPHNEKMEDLDAQYDYMTVALLSLILGLGTAFFAIGLRSIRYSSFCCNDYIRSVITDFAITISVILFTVLKYTLFVDVPTEELNVPDSFAPTFLCCTASCTEYYPTDCPLQEEPYGRRPWVVNIFDLNGKTAAIFIAAGPAVLAFILTFLDNGITWHIVNHPSNKITHGDAYNYDTCISAIMIAVNSLLGLPWLVASTVPCIMHISAMATTTKEGVTTYVQESRLTGLFTHVLVLSTCFALNAIKMLPLPVLYGVFLFMGLVALPAQQFWQRILLFFQQSSLIMESTPYTKYVKPFKRVHMFTLIQLFFFVLLYVVKNWKKISIAFPLFILLCIPVRIYLLPKIFNDDELILLDGSPEEIEEWILFNDTKNDINDEADALIGEMEQKNIDDEVKLMDDGDDHIDHDNTKRETVSTSVHRQRQNSLNSVGSGVRSFFDQHQQQRRERQSSTRSQQSINEYMRQNEQTNIDEVKPTTSAHRQRQSSLNSVGSGVRSFFDQRQRRERQSSTQSQQSINEFMQQNGLMLPQVVPEKINDGNESGSEVSDIID